MMPFSVLRPWGLGILSWVLLGTTAYCGWQAVKEFRRDPRPADIRTADPRLEENGSTSDASRSGTDRVVVENQPRGLSQRFWAYLAATVALLALNFGGFIPVHWLLSNASGPQRESVSPGKELWVDRPDGSRLFVQVHGPESAPTLLLTHGWSLDVTTWEYVLKQLSQRCRVVTWDLPGLGRSKGPANSDWSLEKMANDLDAVVEATATAAPLVLAGHSIGGMITQVFCRLHGEKLGLAVQGIALLHTTYVNPLRTCFAAPLATALELPLITPFNYLTIAFAPLVWLSNWQSYLNGSLHICTRITTFSGKQSWKQLDHAALLAVNAWPGVLARGNLAMQRFDEESTLSQIDVPVLVLSGKHDRMTLPSASAHMEGLLPADRPFQVSSGHLGMWECPKEFASAVTEFVLQCSSHGKTAANTPSAAPTHRK